jgi:photosystem II stability/assembly factor-like uncharacterized protein
MTNRTLHAALLAAATASLTTSLEVHAQQALVPGVADSAVLADLEPRNIGPAVMSGRISDIAVAPEADDRPGMRLGRIMYAASAGGGVWKTTNGGKTWEPVFEDEGASSIGDVALAPSNPDIVWVGTGESNNLRSSSWGDGIYKSTDAGETWTHMGLRGTQHIVRIIVHPTNPDIVYVASPGPLWASGGERGLFKTTDGGRTWTNIKTVSEYTGFSDLVMDPSNPDVLYAASQMRERRPWSFIAGGPESGIWKSTDAGATWTELTNGLPAGDMGRIGLDISQSQPRTLYAVIHAEEGGVFRTDDGGATWTQQSDISSIPWFFGQIRVDPQNVDRVYHLGVQLQVSEDGGREWERIANNTHADQHAMWIDPRDANHLVIGNDGGLFVSYDRGETWDFALNLPVSTFYAIGHDMREPYYWVYGGLQDNGTWGAPNETRDNDGVNNDDWVRVAGGDGFYAAIDPTDPNVVYAESQNGNLRRIDLATGESKAIRPDAPPGGPNLRYNWSAPVVISPHDHRTLYFGSSIVFRSRDRGDTWEPISGDLTRALDRDTLIIMGRKGPGGLGRHDGTAPFGNIATLAESPLRAGLLYAGTDDGVVAVTRDGGANWSRQTSFPGVPALTYVSRVEPSAHAEGTAYATFDGHRNNDFRPYVYRTTDYGQTWTSISANLPEFGSVQVVREHPRNGDLLFVGTEFGVFVSANGGASWSELEGGFPTVAVHDMLIHPRENDLIIGTHGRGIWILDDITPLEQLAQARQARIAHVFTPSPATTLNRRGGDGIFGYRLYETENPPSGALLSYYVAPTATGTLTLAIVNAAGDVVRELPADETPGIHRTSWNLRWASAQPPAPPPQEEEEEEDEGPQFGGGGQDGPYVAPGTYRVQLRSASTAGASPQVVHETSLDVRGDPLVSLTAAELRTLQDARMRSYRALADAHRLVQRLDAARTRLAADSARNAAAITEIDSVLVALRGPRRQGGGGRGGFGGGGGGANQSVIGQLSGVAGQIATLHFLPTPEQMADIESGVAALERTRPRAEAVLQRSGGEPVPSALRDQNVSGQLRDLRTDYGDGDGDGDGDGGRHWPAGVGSFDDGIGIARPAS